MILNEIEPLAEIAPLNKSIFCLAETGCLIRVVNETKETFDIELDFDSVFTSNLVPIRFIKSFLFIFKINNQAKRNLLQLASVMALIR